MPCLRVQYAEDAQDLLHLKEAKLHPLSSNLEKTVASVLKSALQDMLARYETTVTADEETLCHWALVAFTN